MLTKHVTNKLEAYLDHGLPADERRRIEEHVATCPACAHRLFEAQRLANELGPVMKKALGWPLPTPALHHQVRQALKLNPESRRLSIFWAASGRFLNTAGTLAAVAVLLAGAFVVIQSQLPTNEVERGQPVNERDTVIVGPTNTPVRFVPLEAPRVFTANLSTLGDRLSQPAASSTLETALAAPTRQKFEANAGNAAISQQWSSPGSSTETARPKIPGGTIAFSVFDLGLQRYRIHLIEPDGTDLRHFPLDGVSEPALRRSADGIQQVAYRGWGESSSPRALIGNSAGGDQPAQLTHFFEDAQPDWSPVEERIIFASQRESDRRWRLYTIWADGSNERDLRREGKSPTFAPDGYRFAFESCDSISKKQCGLWLGDLGNSEYGSYPFMLDPLAKSPDWSPVSEEIAYMANPNGNWDVYMVKSDGQNLRRLTDNSAVDGLPTWSADGEWLALLSNRNGHWGIWLLHVATGQTSEIYSFSEQETFSLPEQSSLARRNWWDEQLSWSH